MQFKNDAWLVRHGNRNMLWFHFSRGINFNFPLFYNTCYYTIYYIQKHTKMKM